MTLPQDNTKGTSPAQTDTDSADNTNPNPADETHQDSKDGDPADNQDKTPEKGLGANQETEEKDSKEDNKLFGKPESGYDYKEVQLPQGWELNKETAEQLNGLAGELNLSQRGADRLMAIAVEHTKQIQTKLEQAYTQANEAKIQSYKEALTGDKEIGGAKLDDTLKVANVAYEKFASQEVQKVLNETGLSFHPEVVKMFHTIGKQMKNDEIFDAGNPPGLEKSRADILYGSKD